MSDKLYIYSTLASDVLYTTYVQGPNDLPIPSREILIKGGAGVANDRLITPHGVATEIPAEDLVNLMSCPVFLLHKDNGFIKVEEKKFEIEAVTGDMNASDPSRALLPEDFVDDDSVPKVSTDKSTKPKK